MIRLAAFVGSLCIAAAAHAADRVVTARDWNEGASFMVDKAGLDIVFSEPQGYSALAGVMIRTDKRITTRLIGENGCTINGGKVVLVPADYIVVIYKSGLSDACSLLSFLSYRGNINAY